MKPLLRDSSLERLLRQNTVGALRVVQAVLPAMRERGRGRLLFMSSILGRMTSPTRGAFAATKWALEALVETLASEVGHFGVEVALLEPSSVASGALEAAPHYSVESDPYVPLEAQMGGGRGPMLTVEEVATAIADAVEAGTLPLRIPIGEAARCVLSDASEGVITGFGVHGYLLALDAILHLLNGRRDAALHEKG